MTNLFTRNEAAKVLEVSVRHLDNLVRFEGLPVVRLGRRILFRADDLDRWLAERVVAPGAAADTAANLRRRQTDEQNY